MLRHRRGAVAALIAAAALFSFSGICVQAADQYPGIPLKAPQAPPHAFNPMAPPISYGVMFGGDFTSGTGVNSTSAFYRGGYQQSAGFLGGVFVNVPVASFGPRGVPFQSWVWSVTPTIDFMRSSGMQFSGSGGGAPV